MDLKLPDGWPDWALDIALMVTRPYGVEMTAATRHPWEALARHLSERFGLPWEFVDHPTGM